MIKNNKGQGEEHVEQDDREAREGRWEEYRMGEREGSGVGKRSKSTLTKYFQASVSFSTLRCSSQNVLLMGLVQENCRIKF